MLMRRVSWDSPGADAEGWTYPGERLRVPGKAYCLSPSKIPLGRFIGHELDIES